MLCSPDLLFTCSTCKILNVKTHQSNVKCFWSPLVSNLCSVLVGANVNRATANNDHTVVSLACAGGHLAVVELLLAHGADPTHRLKVSP